MRDLLALGTLTAGCGENVGDEALQDICRDGGCFICHDRAFESGVVVKEGQGSALDSQRGRRPLLSHDFGGFGEEGATQRLQPTPSPPSNRGFKGRRPLAGSRGGALAFLKPPCPNQDPSNASG